MSLYYVTGMSGSGKSTVLVELKNRGYTAHDNDEAGFATYYNTDTNLPDVREITAAERTPQWRQNHEWRLPRETVLELKRLAGQKTFFLCGVTANDLKDFWHDVDEVFALCAAPETIRHRILSRTSKSDFGKNPHELALIMEHVPKSEKTYHDWGATIINSDQPIEKVVDDILANVQTHQRQTETKGPTST